jgi:hypothetical protein
MREANQYRPSKKQSQINTRSLEDLRNLYNAASVLEFENWVLFTFSIAKN